MQHVYLLGVVLSRVLEWNPNCFDGRLPHKRLLVVDDNEDIHMMLGDRLEAMGYGVLRATNGVEALAVLGVMPVDGVLLGIGIPVMDGLTLLRELQHYFFGTLFHLKILKGSKQNSGSWVN